MSRRAQVLPTPVYGVTARVTCKTHQTSEKNLGSKTETLSYKNKQGRMFHFKCHSWMFRDSVLLPRFFGLVRWVVQVTRAVTPYTGVGETCALRDTRATLLPLQ